MSDTHDPSSSEERPPLNVIPVPRLAAAPPPSSPLSSFFRWIFRTVFLVSIGINFFLFMLLTMRIDDVGMGLHARYHSGDSDSKNKIAIIRLDGVIMEGTLAYVHKQIEEAATDDRVQAVVLRVNSPGGSITASDDLHKRLIDLRDGTTPGHSGNKKPLIVSMGALAASGGYYVAMPAAHLVAERSTITGSIGVYAAFPNISGLAKQYGFGMEVIKAGEVKDSGSMFKEMKPQERQIWQDMVNHAYDQFLAVCEKGRPKLTGKFRDIIIEREILVAEDNGKETVKYVRRRADGGIFTADQALEFGLIDDIGYLEDAIEVASKLANLGDDYKAVVYDKPQTLMDALLRSQTTAERTLPGDLARAAVPRLWYLAPQSELAGILAAALRRD